jgi:hypothetical protein
MYNISRYEQQGDSLFICINHKEKPVYIEHFFSAEEQESDATKTATIERLVAELYLMADAYVEPLPRISKVEEAQALPVSKTRITACKAEIVAERQAKVDAELAEKEALEKPIETVVEK